MAGSNSTTRGVPRQILSGNAMVPVIGAGQIPQIQYSTGAARMLERFSRDLFQMSDQFENQLDEEAKAEATTQGALAGVTGEFDLQSYGTIRGRAFNKAAVESWAASMDTNSIAKLSELQEKYWNDPAGLQREWGAYTDGVAGELMKRSPEQAVAYRNRNTVRGLSAVEQSKDTAYKLTRSEADAKLIENEAAIRAEVKRVSADLLSDNPDRSRAAMNSISMVQNDLMRVYSAKDPITGKPLYSPEEVAKAKKHFTDLTMTQATLSWFDEQPDKGAAYLKLINGDFKIKVNASNNHVPIVMANKNATRNDPLKVEVQDALKAAAAATGPGLGIHVHSGGQEDAHTVARGRGRRTGSVRHDHGGAADLRLMKDGQVLDFNQNRDIYLKFAENAAAAGLTGIGVDEASGYIHAGGGTMAAWGYRGHSASRKYLPDDFAQAIERGRGEKLESKPFAEDISISEMISPTAMNGLDAEMRSRITFTNQMREKQEKVVEEVIKAGQERNSFELTARLFGAGAADPATGKPLAPPTREEVIELQRAGKIKPGDGEAILKAMATERPQVSDDATKREIQRRIYEGEDVQNMIFDAGSKLSSADSASLLALNKSMVRDKVRDFNDDQKFQFDMLKERLGQNGLFDKFDQGKADRKAMALDEYRRRVLDPNTADTPDVIANDIADRATKQEAQLDNSALSRLIPPRFSTMVPGQYRIDVDASKKALSKAYSEKRISEADLLKEIDNLRKWDDLQKRTASQAGSTKK